jgi:CubicO group peptidase (beta-lactamase class C family)
MAVNCSLQILNTMKKLTLLISLIFLVALQASCQKKNKAFDAIMNETFESDGPGGVALIVQDGAILYHKAFGMANMELGVEMTPEHVFRIGSITKQFTACAILKLAEEGKLDLQDDITKYIEDYPTHGHTITIEHLLTHTSGIKSYTGMMEWTAEVRKKNFTPTELIDFFKNQPMDFVPGEEFRYNNSAYFILGYIIELVSGKPYDTYIEETFFKSLGMDNSYYGSTSRIIHNRADGYARGDEGYINDDFLSMTQPYAAGSLLSTVDDLYKWYRAVMNNEVISQASLEQATSSYVLSNGKHTDYGYGWFIGNIQGSHNIQHGGGINGYLTASMFLPEEDLFVAVFSNCTCTDPGDAAVKMAAIALDRPFEWDSISMDEELLKTYEAVYTSEYDGDMVISYSEGKLLAMRTGGAETELTPFEKDKFFVKEGTSSFHFVRESGAEISSVISRGTGSDIEWKRTAKPIPQFEAIELEESLLKEYLGKYELAPDFILSISLEDEKFYAQASGQDRIEIIPVEEDEFKVLGIDAKLTFNRDKEGTVEGLTLHQNGEHKAKKID